MSPIAGAEQTLVAICIQMGKIQQPLNVTEGISLMNNIVVGTSYQDELRKFQEVRRLGSEDFESGTVTTGW